MNILPLSIKDSLNKAYRKEKLTRVQIDALKSNLKSLLARANNDESEEHNKNLIISFLNDTWYRGKHEINTKEWKDLVIHSGPSSRDTVAVVIEVKHPTNKLEMFGDHRSNVKAIQQLILYYITERLLSSQTSIKRLIITNIYEWYIFDENWFDKHIFQNKRLLRDFNNWRYSGKNTSVFYESIAKPFLEDLDINIPATYFDLRNFSEKSSDRQYSDLYKILSPVNLLKLPFANDSNSLDKRFYNELLHIIGLEEFSEGSKKIIKRCSKKQDASLLENTIFLLNNNDAIYKLPKLTSYGTSRADQIFNIGLELCITWVNRIIFLKLLEAQLLKYQRNNKNYLFLNIKNVFDFKELDNLFFNVLAERGESRRADLKNRYAKVPYLNSSLFEKTELEKDIMLVSDLDNRLTMDIYGYTVLKDEHGKRKKGTLTTLDYLLQFLDAYDFSSEGHGEIQEESRSLINASVLGLIFEKINGYRDGSFFTPGYVTTYMAKELIEKSVLNKFRKIKGWNCDSVEQLFDLINDKHEANEIVNSLKICDPAVGSGHFLVSALNELIALKSKLKILLDRTGKTLRDYTIEVVNDELVVTDDDGELFEYNPFSKESQLVQEALFHEKELLIENCLFGVDLNPNSVKICRLRLWIELLKNAYYLDDKKEELETLPNIDINIKPGNSLISRLSVLDSLGAPSKRINDKILEYKRLVIKYKQENRKAEKKQIETAIDLLKSEFRTEISNNDFKYKALNRYTNEYKHKYESVQLFDVKLTQAQKKDKENLLKEITRYQRQIDEIKSNQLYADAFEWRLEFPEILGNDGEFIGFDLIIGNPPYVPLEAYSTSVRNFFKTKFDLFERKFESSVLFIDEGLRLLNNDGLLGYIAPVTWQTGENYSNFRKYIFNDVGLEKIINLPFNIFEDAFVDTAIYFFSKQPTNQYLIHSFNKKAKVSDFDSLPFNIISNELVTQPKFKVILNPAVAELLHKSKNVSFISLGEITISTQGLSGSNYHSINDKEYENCYPYLNKGNVYNYHLQIDDVYFTDMSHHESLKIFYDAAPKILIRRIINRQDRLSVGYTEQKLVFKKDINPFLVINSDIHPKYLLAVLASKLISIIYLNTSSIASKDDFRQTTLTELRDLPIPFIAPKSQTPFITLADYILFLKSLNDSYQLNDFVPNDHIILSFEELIDGMVYELYFGEEFTANNISLIEPAIELFKPIEKLDDNEKIDVIHNAYQTLRAKENIVRNNLKKYDIIIPNLTKSLSLNGSDQQDHYQEF